MAVNLQQFSFTAKDKHQPIIGPIDLLLNQGEWLVVLGGNGSGKSLLAKLLAGCFPDLLSGKVSGIGIVQNRRLDTNRLVSLTPGRQLVQQYPQLYLSGCTSTVAQEIAFGPENLGLAVNEIKCRVNEAISVTQCENLRHRHPATLSEGETQRLVIASALAMRPKLLLLDEAFSRLTPIATQQLQLQIKQYAKKHHCTVILFERQLFPAFNLSEQFMILESGKALAIGSLLDVFPFLHSTINTPDHWQILSWLVNHGYWDNKEVINNDTKLFAAFKEFYVTAK